MTRQEFVAARARLLLKVQYGTIASLAFAILAAIVIVPLFVDRHKFSAPVALAVVLAPLVIGLGGPFVFRQRALAEARKVGLLCHQCGENLLWSEFVGDKCPECTAVLYAKRSPEASAAALPSKMQFHDRLIAFDGANPLLLAFGFPVGAMACALLLELLYRLLGITETRSMTLAYVVFLLLALFAGPLFYKFRVEVLFGRLGLRCPDCNQPVVGTEFEPWVTSYTLRTRKCPLCDSPVMK